MSYRSATFRSFEHRAYRLFFIGQTVSTIGTWAQKVGQAWLVLELTGSGTLLGITVGLQQAPTLLLTPWAGLLADRVDRRTLLLMTQLGGLPAAALTALSVADALSVGAIIALAVITGVADAVDKPVRHTFAADIVPANDVTNAVALNSAMFNAGKVLGPAAAGVSINLVGVSACFAFNVFSYAVMAITLLRIRPTKVHARTIAPSERQALRAGLHHVRTTPTLAATLTLMAVTGLVAYEWTTAVPMLARVHSPDPAVIGYFFSAMGVGAVTVSLALAGALRATPQTLVVAGASFAASLGLVAAAPNFVTALCALVALGGVATTFRALATSLVQIVAAPALRGRVVSLLIVALNGTSPASGPLIGAISERWGARVAVALGAGISLAAVLVAWHYLRRTGGWARPIGRGDLT
ncbi:MFS transporter [Nocardioides sp.]|uniref:MFS transporter n=1 Tax=Nocardioides sp. TaxID=35761 RepID=UPI002ED9DE93